MSEGPDMEMKDRSRAMLEEIAGVLDSALPDQLARMANEIIRAQTIALHGVGREGLMIRALAMRLFHLGLDVHLVGDMTTPPVGQGDLLIVSAGPGAFATVSGLIDRAQGAGARALCLTAEPAGASAAACDTQIVLKAQTMANDSAAASVLPMGSLFEAGVFLFSELLVLHLAERLDQPAEVMRARHTNLE